MKILLLLILILIPESCTTELNNFGGYHDPRYFENIGIIKNPLGKNIMQNINDEEINVLFENDLPKIFIIGYYRCPQMCNSFRDSLFPVLANSDLYIGTDYEIIMTSINPNESVEEAILDGDKYFEIFFDNSNNRKFLNFTVNNPETVNTIVEDFGFQYRYDEETDDYYHPTIAYLLLSDGTVSSIIEFGERATTINQKVDFAKNNYISTTAEFNPQLFTCMDKDTENKNPKKAFQLAQFGGAWFLSCVAFMLMYNILSKREEDSI